MGTISEKLVYLNGTKQAIKQAINEDFEVIDDNTTFREYADEISSNNAKYKDLIPKETKNATNTLDISNSSGLDKALVTQYGNTYQETTTGKNLLNTTATTQTKNGVTFTKNNDGSWIINGTSTKYTSLSLGAVRITANTTYTLSGGGLGGTYFLQALNGEGNPITSNGYITFTQEDNYTATIYIVVYENKTLNNVILKPMIELGSSVSEYEPYTNGASPNPDYPQAIANVTGTNTINICGKNLFDDSIVTNQWSNYSTHKIVNVDGANLHKYECKQGDTYTLSATFDSASSDGVILIQFFDKEGNSLRRNTSSLNTTMTLTKTAPVNTSYAYIGRYTATPVTIQLEKNTQATTYEPYKEQSFDLDLKSKNLFDKSKANLNKGVNTSNGNLYNSTNQFTTDYIPISVGSYIANGYSSNLNIVYGAIYDSTKTFLEAVTTRTNIKTFTITNTNAAYIRLTGLLTETDTYQLRNGTEEPTEYEPFYDINLCKIGDYKDRIYPLNGKWYLEKNIGKVVLNGSEEWNSETAYTGYYRYILLTLGALNTNNGLNNRFTQRISQAHGGYEYLFIQANNGAIHIQLLQSRLLSSSIADFKTWLSNNNVTVYYVLTTPTTEEITESNYPTLYNQLNNIKLFEGVNHITITNESGLDVEFDITYYKDWKLD